MTEVRYQPGGWFGLVSNSGLVLLPDQLSEDQLLAVWTTLEEGSGLAGILDALTTAFGLRLSSVPSFAIAIFDDRDLRIAVRGEVFVDIVERIDGQDVASELSGEAVTTWTEKAVRSPVSVSVRIEPEPGPLSPTLPISQGVVLASWMTATFYGALDDGHNDWDDEERTDEPEHDRTEDDYDGATMTAAQLRAMQQPVADSRADALPPASTARIDVSTGESFRLDGPIIIGRRPQALRVAPDEIPKLVSVPSPEQDISRSHLEIRVEGEEVVVRDLDTVNGSVLRRQGSAPSQLESGGSTRVLSNDVIDIGDGVSVTFVDLP
ncbi:FHA domain-containing protein [Subtercola boreus]|uniref:FHA domain-containing protein n=1 Tax=Subtercola boreus TaxID=120213 RepID=A0A3E0W8F3_9MICO|nr:FHA domain-containing protein [Subtercola boreus]RFA19416.1 hypothetical protein B7R24_12315 [Subtercola boreus]RFA19677.1 hypothetical protein B7R23_12295 [Subtercola boreus]RFA26042.1 hypothetical protein B7R25_12415 [Subtercola boreus]